MMTAPQLEIETSEFRPCPNCESEAMKLRYTTEGFHVVRCQECRLVYLADPPSSEELYEGFYEGEDDSGALYRADSPKQSLREMYHINRQRIDVLKSFKSEGQLLDIGCGNGFFLKSVSELAQYDGEGIDVASTAVEFARKEFQVSAQATTLADFTDKGNSYDIITLWHVLEHFLDPFHRLAQIRSMLNPGGIAAFEVPNLRSLKFQLSADKWEGGNHPRYHRTFFTSSTMRRALSDAGFTSIRRIPLSYNLPWRNRWFEWSKQLLNYMGMDAFLFFIAEK